MDVPSRKRRKGLGAVMMDDEDEEVDGELVEDDEDEDEEEEEEEDEDDENDDEDDDLDPDQTDPKKRSGVVSAHPARRHATSEESGEIIEVSSSDGLETGTSYRIPPDSARGNGGKQSGYESVSHDSDEFEIQPAASNGTQDDNEDEDDSRYASTLR